VVVRLIDFEDLNDPSDEDEVKDEIQKLLKEKPYLKGAKVSTDGGAGGGGPKTESLNDIIRGAAGR